MPSLKEVKLKITGVKKTSQITKAMNMVAAAKLRGAQEKMEAFRPYTSKFNETMSNLSGGTTNDFPLMDVREVKKVELIVVTSDRGLCGSYNSNTIKLAERTMRAYEAKGIEVSLVCVGKKGNSILKKTGKVRKKYLDIMASFQMFNAREIAADVADQFLKGEIDQAEVIYGEFVSIVSQVATSKPFLPIKPVEVAEEEKKQISGDYINEPSTEEIMDVLQPLYLNVMVYHALLECGAGEQAARMTAMAVVYNKARQAAVTSELMDIVGGAEALNS